MFYGSNVNTVVNITFYEIGESNKTVTVSQL